MMVAEVWTRRMESHGQDNHRDQALRPPARLPALPHRPAHDERAAAGHDVAFQGLVPREIPFELPRLMDINGDLYDEPQEAPKPRRRRIAPRVRLGQMAGKRHEFPVEGLEGHASTEDLDERLRDMGAEGHNYYSQGFNSRGSTPLCMVQVVGVGLSQSLPNLDEAVPKKPDPEPDPAGRPHPIAATDRSSTVAKRLPLPRRHGEMWGNGAADFALSKTKGFIFHAERYQWGDQPEQQPRQKSPEMCITTPQERLQAENDYLEGVRQQRRKRQVVPHREPINLHMGGRQVMFFERMDIMGEIQRLKSVALPVKARDLYVGRGFRLPSFYGECSVVCHRSAASDTAAAGSNDAADCVERQPIKSQNRKGSKFIGDYQSIGGPPASVTQSAPTEIHGATDHDSLVMIGDSFSQSQRYYQGIESDTEWQEPRGKSRIKRFTPGKRTTHKPLTPNPLKAGHMNHISDEEVEKLRLSFLQIDKDTQGCVEFEKIKGQLPDSLSENEIQYAKQIACQHSYFGLDELVTLVCTCEAIKKLTGDAKIAYTKLNFSTLEKGVVKYVELFRSVDRQVNGRISMSSLRELLSTTIGEELLSKPGGFQHIERAVGKDSSQDILQSEFLAFLPFFLFLEPM